MKWCNISDSQVEKVLKIFHNNVNICNTTELYTQNSLLLLSHQSCPTFWDPMDCSTPGLPVPHHLLDLAHVHVHCIGDAMQPFHPLMPSEIVRVANFCIIWFLPKLRVFVCACVNVTQLYKFKPTATKRHKLILPKSVQDTKSSKTP